DQPLERGREAGRVDQDLADEGQDRQDAGVRVAGPEEVLAQRVRHVPGPPVDQRGQEERAAELDRRDEDEREPGHQPGGATHGAPSFRGEVGLDQRYISTRYTGKIHRDGRGRMASLRRRRRTILPGGTTRRQTCAGGWGTGPSDRAPPGARRS